ncbi:glycosyltransferase [Paenibacillus glucanolyticus]|uniref:glycosyltransferase n=1 Tax=Paenibacillus glucanolyticus TaxID=59843 RepID=UPI003680AE0F
MKKKLLFVTTELNRGGAEVALINLLHKLDPKDFEVDVLITDHKKNSGISLIDKLPIWVKLCINSYESNNGFINKLKQRFFYKQEKIRKYGFDALEFVFTKNYDIAFSYGEWFSPDFVAFEVYAATKAVWVHNDLSKAEYFDAENFFASYSKINKYIFVSNESLAESVSLYPFLKEKTHVIHNMINEEEVRGLSNEQVEDFDFSQSKVVITVANLREQKNHSRAIEVFMDLRNKGIKFKWINIGETPDEKILNEVKNKINKYGIEEDFILLGPKENPYSYIKHADIMAVFSDYESWSLVITESKILNTPIVATKTSGAKEQIVQGENGLLTNFTVSDMSEKLGLMLRDKNLQNQIRQNLAEFSVEKNVLNEFQDFVNLSTQLGKHRSSNNRRGFLFIIDSINYQGGGHLSTLRMIKKLQSRGERVSIFTGETPNIPTLKEYEKIEILTWQNIKKNNLFNERLLSVVLSRYYPNHDKKIKFLMTLKSKIKNAEKSFFEYVMPSLEEEFNKYQTICITSEGSGFRSLVSSMDNKITKIQWIHTDYANWSGFNSWTQSITRTDGEIYSRFNKIIFVSEHSRSGFIRKFPDLKHQTAVIPNIMPLEAIKESAYVKKQYDKLKIVTIGRLESEKGYERLLAVAKQLKDQNYDFNWNIIGEGSQKQYIKHLVQDYSLEDNVKVLGHMKNPFPYLVESDAFALLSYYEGLPNTIYESLILGIPVIATNVGGISEQIEHGKTGWLVNNNERDILSGMTYLFENQGIIKEMKKNLENYQYDNNRIFTQLDKLFSDRNEKKTEDFMRFDKLLKDAL